MKYGKLFKLKVIDETGDLIYDADGTVNVNNGKSIIVSTVPTAVRTQTDNTGTLNFLGTTTLYSDIGTETEKLKNVTFAYDSNIDKNIFCLYLCISFA